MAKATDLELLEKYYRERIWGEGMPSFHGLSAAEKQDIASMVGFQSYAFYFRLNELKESAKKFMQTF